MTRSRARAGEDATAPTPLEGLSADLLEAAPDAMIVVDADGRIVFVNTEAVRMFGYAREGLLGEPIEKLLPERFRARHVEHRAVFHEHPRLRPMGSGLDLVARRRDGSEFPVEISLGPVCLRDTLLVTASVRDITARRKLEAEKDELLRVTERARSEAERAREAIARVNAVTEVAVAGLSIDDMLRELLARVHALLGVDVAALLLLDEEKQILVPSAVIGADQELARSVARAVGQGFAGRVALTREPLVIEEIGELEEINPALRAVGVRSLLGVPLVVEGELLGVLKVSTRGQRDFSAEDVRLLQLAADRVALAVKRARLYEAEQKARAEAEASLRARETTERLKDELTNMVVHDLKNPVNGILMMVQLSLRKAAELPEAHRERLQQIALTCGEMTRLIQNLLEISKMEEGKMPIARETILLPSVVEEVEHEYRPVAEQMARRLHLQTDGAPLAALADRALVKRVITNLVVNALRHSGSTDVWVEVAPDPGGDGVAIRVVDHGRGIPESERSRIFEKFAVIRHSVGDASGDTGLGLPFCKLAVERMGGRIELESTRQKTVFTVTLPAASPHS